ncbi:HEAT repeat domain-containing protein [Salmonella enterica]|nr:HEAT repeat domain-containing protein [Salmonella enterica]EDO3571051.1 HEAT repeat domain-containing protein [Salmonella enterica]EDQ6645493.1 HEAT repeat domain-containing protein [Salmonella enterica subsp. enterica serovar Reading]EDR5805399.1 HEAT repeat domain-containing protein [Salmonella enterica subsp. enterica serovar Saintpaul]
MGRLCNIYIDIILLFRPYALGEGRCQADNITRELERLSQSDDMEIKIAAIKALGRIYR